MSVSISGDTSVVGSYADGYGPEKNDTAGLGAAFVFMRDGFMWSQRAYLKASSNRAHFFGLTVDVDENIVVGEAVGNTAEVFGVTTSTETLVESNNDTVLIGIAVGVSVVVLAIIAAVIGIMLFRRKRINP